MAARGAFFVFEGLDRSGKTTQVSKLLDYLVKSKQKVKHFKFPDRSSQTGAVINKYLAEGADINDNALHLLFAANRWEKRDEMEALLMSGVHVVVDRYSYSGVAYSAAKGLPHLTREWCAGMEAGLLAPDAVFYLQVDPQMAQSREEYGVERYEKVDFQRRVAEEFMQLRSSLFHPIDASRSIDEIAAEIQDIAEAVVTSCASGSKSLEELWDSKRAEGGSGRIGAIWDSNTPTAGDENVQGS